MIRMALFLLVIATSAFADTSPFDSDKYFEARCRLIESRLEGVHDTFNARLSGMDAALKLKTDEMDRRLEGLNELRKEVVRDRDQYLRKDTFEINAASALSAREVLSKDLAAIRAENIAMHQLERDRGDKETEVFRNAYIVAHQDIVGRVTVLETRIIVWAAAFMLFLVLLQFGMKYLIREKKE